MNVSGIYSAVTAGLLDHIHDSIQLLAVLFEYVCVFLLRHALHLRRTSLLGDPGWLLRNVQLGSWLGHLESTFDNARLDNDLLGECVAGPAQSATAVAAEVYNRHL